MRTAPDYCEAYLPYGTRVTYTYEELGLGEGAEFVITNEISRATIRL